jgi:hypothetical protein
MDGVRKGDYEIHHWAMDEPDGRSSRPRMVEVPACGRNCLSLNAVKTGDAWTVKVSYSSKTNRSVAEHDNLTSDAGAIEDSTTVLYLVSSSDGIVRIVRGR